MLANQLSLVDLLFFPFVRGVESLYHGEILGRGEREMIRWEYDEERMSQINKAELTVEDFVGCVVVRGCA